MTLLIARRPVFDLNEGVFAYSLAVRGPADASGFHKEAQLEELIDTVFVETGIDVVAEGRPVFVPATRDLLTGGTLRALPADRVFIEVPGDALSDSDLVGVCLDLASTGYRVAFAVDERTPLSPALDTAAVIKIDVAGLEPDALARVVARFKDYPGRRLATNVLHRGERDRCARHGFDLFEGVRFSASEKPARRGFNVDHLQAFRALKLLRDPNASDRQLEDVIQGDVGLSYKLLRLVNSTAVGGRNVRSIGHAVRMLGRDQIGRWLSIFLVADGEASPVRAEQTHLALVRAHMCEQLADLIAQPHARGSLFLVGLFSVLDQLLDVPMATLCESMDLAPDLRAALLNRADALGNALHLVETYVNGDWSEVERIAATMSISPPALQPLYLDSLHWAMTHRPS